tara:strand:- start:1447 stop:2607 length:1161 start_codon:yes stop_codon:yes gene_type:complete
MRNIGCLLRYQAAVLLIFLGENSFSAMEMDHEHTSKMSPETHGSMHKASHHPPITIMGGNFHKKGEFMLSFRFMRMEMKKNQKNGKELSDYQIISHPNPFSMGNMASNLSVVPKKMNMEMGMMGLMYGFSDRINGMLMLNYINKHMLLNTYSPVPDLPCIKIYPSPPECRSLLGSFTTSSSGLSHFSSSILIKLKETNTSRWQIELNLMKSLGKKNKKGEVLSPMNNRLDLILPYSMQTGDKGTRLISGLTYINNSLEWSYGFQAKINRVIEKKEWNYGNNHLINAWIQKDFFLNTSLSFRYSYFNEDKIRGRDLLILAPVQTSNPSNYGGRSSEIGIGLNGLINHKEKSHSNRIGLELIFPVEQNLNGLQMQKEWSIQLGYQTSF